jgi:hypothetical protein
MTRIFISYKREDETFARSLRQHLLDAGYEVWMDIFDIPAGAHWPDEIQKGLESCDVVLGLMTPKAMDSRNVKNEWDWAIVYQKRFIPLLIEKCTVHLNYISLNWIDFTKGHDVGFASLETTLKSSPATSTAPADSYRDYLQKLYERINDYLARAIITRSERDEAEPIRLVSESTQGMVDALFEKRDEVDPLFAIGFGDEPSVSNKPFTDFYEAFKQLEGRILLLGEPGAGKTIMLLHFGRDSIVRRIQDTKQPLPILATIPTWDIRTNPPLIDWLATSYSAPPNVSELIQQGKALLLLDGLDELGGEREDPQTKERIPDPRPRFMDALQVLSDSNSVLITCRVKDYEEIGKKIALKGALTIKALSDSQIRDYLRDLPELWTALQADAELRKVAGTPLLLSYFAFGYRDAVPEDRKKLQDLKGSSSELRNAIFEKYVKGQYEREQRKLKSRGGQISFPIGDIYEVLGRASVNNITIASREENVLPLTDFKLFTKGRDLEFITIAMQLRIVLPLTQSTFRFVHILLGYYFAYIYSIATLQDKNIHLRRRAVVALRKIGNPHVVEPIIDALYDPNEQDRNSETYIPKEITDIRDVEQLIKALYNKDVALRRFGAKVLGEIHDDRAVEPLIFALNDKDLGVRSNAIQGLGKIKDESAVESLLIMLTDRNNYIRRRTVEALGEIKSTRAIKNLITALEDKDAGVYKLAAKALENIGTPEALEAVRQWRASQGGASGVQGDDE